jgi:hypothetical protein
MMSEQDCIATARQSAEILKRVLPLRLFYTYLQRGAMAYIINATVDDRPGKKFRLGIQIQFGTQVFDNPTKAGLCMWVSIIDRFGLQQPDYWARKQKVTFDGWGWLKVALPSGHIVSLSELITPDIRRGQAVATDTINVTVGRRDIDVIMDDFHFITREPILPTSPIYPYYSRSVSRSVAEKQMARMARKRKATSEELPVKKRRMDVFLVAANDYMAMLRLSTKINDPVQMANYISRLSIAAVEELIPRKQAAASIYQAALQAAH